MLIWQYRFFRNKINSTLQRQRKRYDENRFYRLYKKIYSPAYEPIYDKNIINGDGPQATVIVAGGTFMFVYTSECLSERLLSR